MHFDPHHAPPCALHLGKLPHLGRRRVIGLVVADELARACVVAAALLPGLLLAAKREVLLQVFRRLAIPRGKMKEPRGKTKQGKMKEPKKYPTFGEDWSSCEDSGNDSNPENGASEGVRDPLQPSQARARCV